MIKLTKKQAELYKQRWQQIESIQTQELRSTPMSLKFKQLCLLMNFFYSRQLNREREKEVSVIRRRWIILKKNDRR